MGRHELYAELPFVAVLGLQKQERSLSMAWSNAAALLENEESDKALMLSTMKEEGMDFNEKEERVRRMSVILLDEMEGTDGVYLTLPLVVAVTIASMFTFNGKVVTDYSELFLLRFLTAYAPMNVLQLGTTLVS